MKKDLRKFFEARGVLREAVRLELYYHTRRAISKVRSSEERMFLTMNLSSFQAETSYRNKRELIFLRRMHEADLSFCMLCGMVKERGQIELRVVALVPRGELVSYRKRNPTFQDIRLRALCALCRRSRAQIEQIFESNIQQTPMSIGWEDTGLDYLIHATYTKNPGRYVRLEEVTHDPRIDFLHGSEGEQLMLDLAQKLNLPPPIGELEALFFPKRARAA